MPELRHLVVRVNMFKNAVVSRLDIKMAQYICINYARILYTLKQMIYSSSYTLSLKCLPIHPCDPSTWVYLDLTFTQITLCSYSPILFDKKNASWVDKDTSWVEKDTSWVEKDASWVEKDTSWVVLYRKPSNQDNQTLQDFMKSKIIFKAMLNDKIWADILANI